MTAYLSDIVHQLRYRFQLNRRLLVGFFAATRAVIQNLDIGLFSLYVFIGPRSERNAEIHAVRVEREAPSGRAPAQPDGQHGAGAQTEDTV